MLDEPDMLGRTLIEQYGRLLPDTLIRSTVHAAPAAHVSQADAAALADAALRAPEPAQR